MLRTLVTVSLTTILLGGALLTGDASGGAFSQIPRADAFEIVCSDGSQPTCNPIFNGEGRVIGYTCICG